MSTMKRTELEKLEAKTIEMCRRVGARASQAASVKRERRERRKHAGALGLAPLKADMALLAEIHASVVHRNDVDVSAAQRLRARFDTARDAS